MSGIQQVIQILFNGENIHLPLLYKKSNLANKERIILLLFFFVPDKIKNMEYKKNLKNEIKINKVPFILGILIILFAVFWIPIRIFENDNIRVFDWIYITFYLSLGLVQIFYGWKQSYGKASILINDNILSIKNRLFTMEIDWKDIQSIERKSDNIVIYKTNNTLKVISTKWLKNSFISELSNIISIIAKEKGINCSI